MGTREEYFAGAARVHSWLQWIQYGDERFKFYFDFLKRVAGKRVLALRRAVLCYI